MLSKSQLRQAMRRQRQSLSLSEQTLCAKQIQQRLIDFPVFTQAQHIALYLPIQAEVPTTALLQWIWQTKRQAYLPLLGKHSLSFAEVTPTTVLKPNRFGILEPQQSQDYAWGKLDIVLLPVVAYDSAGFRLGMGGGCYDKTFAHKSTAKPYLIGLAYAFQAVSKLPTEFFDRKLDAVVNEHTLCVFD